ncbi:fatty acid--CoA ligase [Gordonia jinhuaensis]|uniref:Acyl-CoA synthetase n=1 Tax=Gordonia jinhuaensis TaxID=1517702 RepID=A0A916TB88_9ACTN|nr:AMP-binding protein [Gordonia jinhuaensis]GGB38610.1 acyl-CoA synthetase [Gordonia jinhuaensis]
MSGLYLAQRVRELARTQPDSLALVDGDQRYTAAEFDALTTSLASGLSRVAAPGDHVGAAVEVGIAGGALFVACAKAGMVFTPVNWRLPATEIAAIAVDAEMTVFVADPQFADAAAAVADALPQVTVLDTGDELDVFIASGSDADPGLGDDPQTPILQLYTSGTTGLPKGVLITNHNLHNDADTLTVYRWQEDSVALGAMPMFHIAGTGWFCSCVSAGIPLVLLRRFDAQAAAELIETWRVSHIFLVPSTIQLLLDHLESADQERDLSSLRLLAYGSAPITPTLLTRAMTRLRCDFLQRYGMTETAGSVTALRAEDHHPNGAGSALLRSVGTPLPGVELAIGDISTGEFLGPGQTGEILTRSRTNARSYWKRPEATAALYTAEGYLRTGDAGHIDENGYLFVTDRIKDMIISGGENIYPVEIESVLAEHPSVAEVAVVGVPHEVWGEEVVAVVRAAPTGPQIDIDELIDHVAARLGSFKKPRRVFVVDELPRGATGKLLKRSLRQQFSRPPEVVSVSGAGTGAVRR